MDPLHDPKSPRSRNEPSDRIAIDPLRSGASDAVCEALTAMLHRAYRRQVELGLRPLAGRQTAEVTRKRCESGEAFIARHLESGALVGMILLDELEEAALPQWFLRPEVSHFSLFAVEPTVQGLGIGAGLIDIVERRAAALGRRELALSMAEPDGELMAYYLRRGFRFIEHWQWPYTNYQSAILSRAIATDPAPLPAPADA